MSFQLLYELLFSPVQLVLFGGIRVSVGGGLWPGESITGGASRGTEVIAAPLSHGGSAKDITVMYIPVHVLEETTMTNITKITIHVQLGGQHLSLTRLCKSTATLFQRAAAGMNHHY